jgi:hypothetical protein
MLRIFYMQATGYASGHEYIDYGEVVIVLDEWDERLVEALSTSYDSSSFNPGPLRQIWLRLVDLLPGLVPDDKMAETGKS